MSSLSNRMQVLMALFSLGALVSVGCGDSQPKEPVIPEAAKEKALAAKDALFEKLSGKLMAAVMADGPASAITVCNEAAPQLAQEVADEHNVKIGRTALKLRNPNNQRPAWAKGRMDVTRTKPQFLNLPKGGVGAILPIMLKPQCLACHGPQEQLAEGVAERLAELYPDDKATGFQDGDLRGWFWVEVPAENAG